LNHERHGGDVEEELLDPGFSVEEGVKLVVSGGFVSPEKKDAGANRA
jgi:uncharacterized membrane protein